MKMKKKIKNRSLHINRFSPRHGNKYSKHKKYDSKMLRFLHELGKT